MNTLVKPATGSTSKHAGGTKHAGSAKHQPSKAQLAARKKFQQAGAAASHVHAVAKASGHPAPAKWTPTASVACCAIEALAASLHLQGRHVTAADMLELYWRVTGDPDAGMSIETALEAAASHGLAGTRLLDAHRTRDLADGAVLGVDLAQRHALTVDGHGVWSWGAWRPVSCGLLAAADEAWTLEWAVA